MNKNLHFIAGRTSAATLRQFLQQQDINDDVLAIEGEFQYEPLLKDFSEKELKLRAHNIEHIFGCRGNDYDYFKNIQKVLSCNYDQYDTVIIWYGNSVNELLTLYFACKIIKKDIHYVDILTIKDDFHHFPNIPNILTTGVCSPQNFKMLYDNIKPMSFEQKQTYISLWDNWSKSDAALRIIDSNYTIIEVAANYFDEAILARCSTEYKDTARIFGELLCDLCFQIGDGFLNTRMIELVRAGKIYVRARANLSKFQKYGSSHTKVEVNGVDMSSIACYQTKLAK